MEITEQDLQIAPELRGLKSGNIGDVLNNFNMHFPQVSMTTKSGKKLKASVAYYRRIMKELEKLDTRRYGDIGENSEKKLNQTPREFYVVVAKTVREQGLTMKEVAIAATSFRASQSICHSNLEEWAPTLLRVYIALRKKGYNKKDLTG